MSGFGAQTLGSSGYGSGSVGPYGVRSGMLAFFEDRGSIFVSLDEPVLSGCPSSGGDALNTGSWTVVDGSGDSLQVTGVEPLDGGFLLLLWEPPRTVSECTVSLRAYVGSWGGYAPVAMTWRCLSTVASTSKRRDVRRDVRSDQYIGSMAGGIVVVGGDYALEHGARLRKKLLLRRLSTASGAFRHARSYGSAPPIKLPYSAGELEALRSRIVQACLQEYEAVSAEVRMEVLADGVVACHVEVQYSTAESVEAAASYSPDGAYLGGE